MSFRSNPAEIERSENLLTHFPARGRLALDIGARDGHFSRLLAERFEEVIALDLERPNIDVPRVRCVKGDASALDFPTGSMDFVFCAEVLEHIPTGKLEQVCTEIQRVARDRILIGVPFRQDIRVGRTTCRSCGGKNPPWGHVNRFDIQRIERLFSSCRVLSVSFVGMTSAQTNAVAAKLMDLAGNPFGTYEQDEPCIHCGAQLKPPPERTLRQKVLTKLAAWGERLSSAVAAPRGKWIHVLLSKDAAA